MTIKKKATSRKMRKTKDEENITTTGAPTAEHPLAALLSSDTEPSLDKLGIYLLMSEITNETIKPVIEWILKNNLCKTQFKNMTLIINSPGGSVTDAFALIDTMKGSGIPIHTIGLGEVSSAGLMIFMAGHKGERLMTPNASILSHQYSWGRWGKEHELVSTGRALDLTSEMILGHYKKCTGLSEKRIREILLPASDVWLSAKEAKKYGICDKIKKMY